MTAAEILRAVVKSGQWESLGADSWALDCPTTGGWFAASAEQRDSFEAQRRARIAAALDVDKIAALVEELPQLLESAECNEALVASDRNVTKADYDATDKNMAMIGRVRAAIAPFTANPDGGTDA